MHLLGHRCLRELLGSHLLLILPRDDALYGDSCGFFEYGFFGGEIVEAAADMGVAYFLSFFKYTSVAPPPQRMRQPMLPCRPLNRSMSFFPETRNCSKDLFWNRHDWVTPRSSR